MKFTYALLILFPLLLGCEQSITEELAITEEQALAIVWELPETKAWAKYIEEKTKGEVRAALMVPSPTPKTIGENEYWSVGFYENHPTHTHLWQSFSVRLDGKEILVDNIVTGDYSTLESWREKEKPMERIQGLP